MGKEISEAQQSQEEHSIAKHGGAQRSKAGVVELSTAEMKHSRDEQSRHSVAKNR